MKDLFGFEDYSQHEFPMPQYLGAKYYLRQWLSQYIPRDCCRVLDAFGGSQSVSYLLKEMGKETLTNDFLNCCNQVGKALIENPSETLSKDDLAILFDTNQDPSHYNLIEELYTNLFFSEEDAALLDSFRSNVPRLANGYKQSLALAVMCRSMTRKVTMGHFAHTQAFNYASDPARVKRNRSLVRPLKTLFFDLLPQYNAAVFDNKKHNQSFNENILDLLPTLTGVDLVYFDPPYCGSHADYQSFYHLLETYVEYWKDKQFVNGTKRYEPKRYSGFDKKSEAIHSFELLFERAQSIPVWLISYNDRSYPDLQTMTRLIEPYRNVRTVSRTYLAGRGGKGSVAGSNELLLICRPN
jgi:adenine-specific DNA-methyltransferase